jgi:hypothetical protein
MNKTKGSLALFAILQNAVPFPCASVKFHVCVINPKMQNNLHERQSMF